MRKLYGSLAGLLLAVLVLSGVATSVQAQSFIPYPTLSLRNYHLPPGDGLLRVVPPSAGTDRYFLVPVWVWNEVDTTKNPNNSWLVSGNPNGPPGPGQHLEPIRSFQFQLWYNNEVMELDTLHGSPVILNGPSIVSAPGSACATVTSHPDTGLATNFYITYNDQSANNPQNPYSHVVRIAGASSIPLPKNAPGLGDSGYTEHNGILCWLRFHVVPGPAPGGDMHLDSVRFNDHAGDTGTSTVGSLDFTHGNLGGGIGTGGAINRGTLSISYLNSGPSFELRPLPNFTPLTDPNTTGDSLVNDLVYDPTVSNGTVAQSFVLDDGVSGTELDNFTITTGAPWLDVNCGPNPGGGKNSLFFGLDAIDEYNQGLPLSGPASVQLWLTVPNAASLAPGVYYSTVTFSNPDAINSPFQLRVRFVRERNPDEPVSDGTGTGIQLQITNGCNPICSSPLIFGTGRGASDSIDELFGEFPVTNAQWNGNVALGTCIADFVPQDPNLQAGLQANSWDGYTRDIRDSATDTTLIYQVHFYAGSNGNSLCYPVKVCVDPTQFPDGARVLMKFTLNGSDQPIDLRNATSSNGLECVTITDQRINTFYIEYTPATIAHEDAFLKKNSWSLISLPVIPPNPAAGPPNGPNFKYALTQPYQYESQSSWTPQPTMQFGRGYMIRYGSYIGTDSVVAGTRSFTASNVQISEGWNSIGATSGPGQYAQSGTANDGTVITLQPLPGGPVPSLLEDELWEFTPEMGYDMTSFFEPGKGYFIKVDNPGYWNITTPPPPAGGIAQQEKNPACKISVENSNLRSQLTQVTMSDAAGNGQSLYFGNATTTKSEANFEMPNNFRSFDARFDLNSGMMSYNHNSYVVNLHATSYPVTMKFTNASGEVTVTDMNGNLIGTASNNGTVTITNPTTQIRIAEKSTDGSNAVGYSLTPNSPNPFAQTSTISYSLPQESVVSLVVYNQMGQAVQTLVNGVVGAGSHQVQFDGSQLPSGTYYYTLKAGNFVQTMSMTLNHQ